MFTDLQQVIAFYAETMHLDLSADDRDDLEQFLGALSDPFWATGAVPERVGSIDPPSYATRVLGEN